MDVLASHRKALKEKKGIQSGKKEIKLSLFADNTIGYIKNLKNHTNFLELISEFGKVSRCIIKIKRTLLYIYILTMNIWTLK